jgi:hypothetical protein
MAGPLAFGKNVLLPFSGGSERNEPPRKSANGSIPPIAFTPIAFTVVGVFFQDLIKMMQETTR